MISIKELAELAQVAIYDPVSVTEAAFSTMRDLKVNGGSIEFVDPSNPLVLSITNSAVLASTIAEHNADLNRKQYAFFARDLNDLYLHMSDKDFIGRFANPSRIKAFYRAQVDDLIQHMVEVPGLNHSKLVIPRHSYLTIDGLTFSILYPIVIKKQKYGKFSVSWDTAENTPLLDLETNIIGYKIERFDRKDWLSFEFDMQQIKITTANETVSKATDTRLTVDFEDHFHYCRVFNVKTDSYGNQVREELLTSHNALIYNNKIPTAVLKVLENKLEVYIPSIYTTTGLIKDNSTIQVDVYSTKGPMDIPLGGYSTNEFKFTLHSTNKKEFNQYVAPNALLNTMQVFSASTTAGGSHALTFEELKEKVISGGLGDPTLPVAAIKLKYALRELGYEVILYVDNISTRIYLATRDLPIPKDDKLHSPIASAVETFSFRGNYSEITKAIIEHDGAYTITPETLFTIDNGFVDLVPDSKISQLKALPPTNLAMALNTEPYFWTPFYYVIDTKNNQLAVRAYHLDAPTIKSMTFEEENTTTDFTSSTISYEITKEKCGYKIFLYTECSQPYLDLPTDKIFAQLSFMPRDSNIVASINGSLHGTIENGYVWLFQIDTKYNVDALNELILNNFTLFDNNPRNIPVPLDVSFNVLYGVSIEVSPAFKYIESESILARNALSDNAHVITHEYLHVKFGVALDYLWKQARSFVDAEYERYPEDIVKVYEEDIYEAFPDGEVFKEINGELVYNIVHKKGEPVVINNEKQYLARKGDFVVANGTRVPVADRFLLRYIDILFLEASFRFADNLNAKEYLENTINSIVVWCNEDMRRLRPRLLDLTWVFFTPKKTASTVEIQVGNAKQHIQAAQELTVIYHLVDEISVSRQARERLDIERITSEVLSQEFAKSTIISVSTLEEKLKEAIGSAVLNVHISGLGGDRNLQVVIIASPAHRLTIGKRVRARPSGEIYVEDSINVEIIREKDTYNN